MNVFEVQNTAGWSELRLFGQVDAAIVQEMRPLLQDKIPANCSRLIVDLGKVDFLDSHGVGLFVSLLKKVHGNNGRLFFAGADGQPAAVLKMVGFTRPYVAFCHDAAEARTLCAG